MHLKAIQQMAKIPRSIGVPPLSDSAFEQALTVQAQASNLMNERAGTPGGSDDEGKINPLAGMGLTDEQYSMILQNLVNGEPFMGIPGLNPADMSGTSPSASSAKRPLEEGQDQERTGKRGRFEIVE